MAAKNDLDTIPDNAIDPFNGAIDHSILEFDQLMAMVDTGEVIHLRELDDTEQVDKINLVGVPFIITSWERKQSLTGPYVLVRGKTRDGNIVFADGGTGIQEQLIKYGIDDKPILIPKGLRESRYTFENEAGNTVQASTFYLDTSR